MQQNLPARQEHSLAGFRDQLLNTIEQISDLIHPVTVAAKGEAENLGHSVTNLVGIVHILTPYVLLNHTLHLINHILHLINHTLHLINHIYTCLTIFTPD